MVNSDCGGIDINVGLLVSVPPLIVPCADFVVGSETDFVLNVQGKWMDEFVLIIISFLADHYDILF